MSKWSDAAKQTVVYSSKYADMADDILDVGDAATSSTNAFSRFGKGVKDSYAGLKVWAASGTGMATLGAVGLIGGLTVLSAVFDRLNKNVFKVDYGTNLESASKAIDDYTSTTSELESVNSELSTTQQKIAEINAQDSISLSDEAELSRLQEQNNELERKKTLLENMANAQKVAAGSTAALALSTTSEDDVYKNKVDNNLYGMAYADGNGNSADWITDAEQIKTTADEIVNVNNQLENMKDAQAAATDPKEVKKYQKEIESLSKYQADLNADLSTRVEAASKNYEAILGDPQYTGLAKQYEEAFESVNNIDLSPAERELNNLNKFFDNSKGGKFLKEELMDASDSTTELRDALDSMGISLDDVGVENISTLKRYLDEAKSSADGVSDAISGFDGKLSTVDAAFETENQDANYSKMMEYYNKGNELYNAGLVGTDDFQSLTQMFSPYKINEDDYVYDADGYVEAWENARDSVARYFGNEDPLQGLVNFTDDLRGAELLSDGENGMEWKFKNTAEAADALGQSLEVTEAMLHGMEAYGAEFDDVVFSGEGIEAYKGNLEGIRDIFNSLEDGAYKDWLGNMLEQYDNEYAGLEEDLAGLSEEQIVKIKFEYDMANLRQQIADLQEEAQASGENKDWASVNVANKKYRSQREGETGYDGEDSKSYEQATDNILTLQEQLDDNITDDQKVAVQKQIDGIYDVQNAYQDAFANGEVADWEEYLNSDKAQDVLNEVAKSAGITKEELAQLLGTDLGGITPDPIHLKFEGEVDQNELQSQIDAMTIGSTITFDANVDGVQAEVNVIKNTDGSVIYTANVGGVIQQVEQVRHEDGTITYKVVNPPPEEVAPANQDVSQTVADPVPTEAPTASQGVIRSVIEDVSSYLPPIFQTVFRTIIEQKATGTMFSPAQASGTMSPTMLSQAHAYGTGKVSLPRDEVALVNEIGRESRIRSGKWELLPPGMHQEKLKKGDIILSAAQTAALMKYGKAAGTGKAYANGTIPPSVSTTAFSAGTFLSHAYANGWRLPTAASGTSSNSGSGYVDNSTSGSGYVDNSTYEDNSAYEDNSTTNNTYNVDTNTSSSSGDDDEPDPEMFDWIERKIKALQEATDEWKRKLESLMTFKAQNSYIDKTIESIQAEINNLNEAYNGYMSKASSIGLSSDYINKIQSGQINIEDIADEDLQEKIGDYQDLYDKAQDCHVKMQELAQDITDFKYEKIDNIVDDFDNMNSHLSEILKNYEVINKLAEKQGKTLTAKDYDNVIKYNNAIKDNREKELKTLQAEYDNLMKNQEGFVGTDKWFEMQETMTSLKNEIADVNLELEDVKDNIHEANWASFTKNVEANKDKIDELGRAIDLLNEDNFFTEDGGLTSEGLTKYALLGQQLNTAKKQVAEYENAIKKLNDDLKKGNITQSEYTELLRDYRDESQSAADDVNEYRKAMVELTKEGIEKQVDAQKELISGRKEALRTQKEYDDYQKKIRDKNKDILSIQSQLAVLDGQTGAEAERKRRELQAQLRELEEERQELVEDRNYDMILNGYDELEDEIDKKYDEITHKLDSSLTEQDKVVSDNLLNVSKNYGTIVDELSKLGVSLSESITDPWKNGTTATKEYLDTINNAAAESNIATGKINTDLREEQHIIKDVIPESSESEYKEPEVTTPPPPQNNSPKGIEELGLDPSPATKGLGWLAKDVSVRDRILWNGYASTNRNYQLLHEWAGGNGNWIGSASQNIDILNHLKQAGFKRGGVVSLDKDMINRAGEQGIALVRNEDVFLNREDSEVIKDLINVVPRIGELINDIPNIIDTTDVSKGLSSINALRSEPSIEMNFDSFISVDGNVDKYVLHDLKELLTPKNTRILAETLGTEFYRNHRKLK